MSAAIGRPLERGNTYATYHDELRRAGKALSYATDLQTRGMVLWSELCRSSRYLPMVEWQNGGRSFALRWNTHSL